MSTQGVCEDTVLGAVGLVVVCRAVPLVPQEQVYSTAGTTAVHICVVVIVLGRVVEVGVAVVYDSIVGSVLVDGLEEQLVVVLHKIVFVKIIKFTLNGNIFADGFYEIHPTIILCISFIIVYSK